MPKKEDGLPWRSRSRFTKAVKEETQLPISGQLGRGCTGRSGPPQASDSPPSPAGGRAGRFSQGLGQSGQIRQGLQPPLTFFLCAEVTDIEGGVQSVNT